MSTRSRIAIEDLETGKVRSVYCHFDGYPDGVGKTLVEHYRDRDKVEALIALGDLSVLDAEVAPPSGTSHKFGDAYPGVTVAYGRDRGETGCETAEDADAAALYAGETETWGEWLYLYRQGVWFVTEVGGGAGAGLVNAGDPDGTAPANWQNLEGVLEFVPHKRASYTFDPAQLPTFSAA